MTQSPCASASAKMSHACCGVRLIGFLYRTSQAPMDCEICKTLTFPASGVSGCCGYGKPGPDINVALLAGLGGAEP